MVNNNIGIADLDVRTFAFLVHSNTGHTESSKRKTSHLITFSGVKDCKVPWTNLSLVQGFFFTFYVDIVGETLGNTAHHGQRTHHALNLKPAMPMNIHLQFAELKGIQGSPGNFHVVLRLQIKRLGTTWAACSAEEWDPTMACGIILKEDQLDTWKGTASRNVSNHWRRPSCPADKGRSLHQYGSSVHNLILGKARHLQERKPSITGGQAAQLLTKVNPHSHQHGCSVPNFLSVEINETTKARPLPPGSKTFYANNQSLPLGILGLIH